MTAACLQKRTRLHNEDDDAVVIDLTADDDTLQGFSTATKASCAALPDAVVEEGGTGGARGSVSEVTCVTGKQPCRDDGCTDGASTNDGVHGNVLCTAVDRLVIHSPDDGAGDVAKPACPRPVAVCPRFVTPVHADALSRLAEAHARQQEQQRQQRQYQSYMHRQHQLDLQHVLVKQRERLAQVKQALDLQQLTQTLEAATREAEAAKRAAEAASKEADALRLLVRAMTADALPKHWDHMDDGVESVLVPVPLGTREYDQVLCRLHSRDLQNSIVSIERVQNKRLWAQYAAIRKLVAREVRLRCGPDVEAAAPAAPVSAAAQNTAARAHVIAHMGTLRAAASTGADDTVMSGEAWLLHGTRATEPKLLCFGTGIDPRYADLGYFGRASYFTTDVQYLAQSGFIHRAEAKVGKIILAQVATGFMKVCEGCVGGCAASVYWLARRALVVDHDVLCVSCYRRKLVL